MFEGSTGLRFDVDQRTSSWSGAVLVGTGAARLNPVGQSAYLSPPETRFTATVGLKVGRQLTGPWSLFVTAKARRIFRIDLTGLPERDSALGLYPFTTRVGSRWIRSMLLGVRGGSLAPDPAVRSQVQRVSLQRGPRGLRPSPPSSLYSRRNPAGESSQEGSDPSIRWHSIFQVARTSSPRTSSPTQENAVGVMPKKVNRLTSGSPRGSRRS